MMASLQIFPLYFSAAFYDERLDIFFHPIDIRRKDFLNAFTC